MFVLGISLPLEVDSPRWKREESSEEDAREEDDDLLGECFCKDKFGASDVDDSGAEGDF